MFSQEATRNQTTFSYYHKAPNKMSMTDKIDVKSTHLHLLKIINKLLLKEDMKMKQINTYTMSMLQSKNM